MLYSRESNAKRMWDFSETTLTTSVPSVGTWGSSWAIKHSALPDLCSHCPYCARWDTPRAAMLQGYRSSGFVSSMFWVIHKHTLQHGSFMAMWLHREFGQTQELLSHPYPLPTLSNISCRHAMILARDRVHISLFWPQSSSESLWQHFIQISGLEN